MGPWNKSERVSWVTSPSVLLVNITKRCVYMHLLVNFFNTSIASRFLFTLYQGIEFQRIELLVASENELDESKKSESLTRRFRVVIGKASKNTE